MYPVAGRGRCELQPGAALGSARRRALLALVLLPWLWITPPARAQTDSEGYLTVVVGEGQLLRDIAEDYLGDPDLWPEILATSGLESPAEAKSGVTLRIPKNQVSLANDALRQALAQIREANDQGARVFAAESIDRAVDLLDDAKLRRQEGEWERCRELAQQARAAAESALDATRRLRDADAQAVLASRSGRVEARRAEALGWANAPEGAALVEKERLRTLSESRAQVLFADESQLELGPNSQAEIQRMRMDLLNHRQDASVSLVEGDVYALLGGSSRHRGVDVEIPGVRTETASKDFWVSRQGSTTKIANYDEAAMHVGSEGGKVALGRNQGTVIEGRAAPSDPRNLLAAPELLEPADDHVSEPGPLVLRWSEVERAHGYRLDVARDAAFRRLSAGRPQLEGRQERLEGLGEGEYYWRVAAVDALGFPGAKSRVRRFRVRADRAAPYLAVGEPTERAILRRSPVRIVGQVERGTTLTLNEEAVTPEADGSFAVTLPLEPGLNGFVLEARDASGNLTRVARSVIYMPDRSAAVELDDAPRDTGLVRTGPRSFLTRHERFVLAGHTRPESRIEVISEERGAVARSAADAAGAFRVNLALAGERGEFRLLVTAPSGYVSEVRFTVTRDSEPPGLAVDDEPAAVTREARLELRGRVTGADGLTWNGDAVELAGEAFAAGVDLAPGENRLELVARDRAGNEARWQRTVVLDREAPELLEHTVSPAVAAGGETVEVTVRAADASGLKRTASFVVRVGSSRHTGTLLLDPLSGTYRATLALPRDARGPVALQSVVLEDYNGNQQTYQF